MIIDNYADSAVTLAARAASVNEPTFERARLYILAIKDAALSKQAISLKPKVKEWTEKACSLVAELSALECCKLQAELME